MKWSPPLAALEQIDGKYGKVDSIIFMNLIQHGVEVQSE